MSRPSLARPPCAWLWSGLGLAALLLAWQLLARRLGPLLMATPVETWQALRRLLGSEEFALHAGASLLRIALGVGLGIGLGLLLALLAARSPRLGLLLEPLRWLLMALPPVIVLLLAMLWLGMGDAMVIAVAIALLSPAVYLQTVRGLQLLDPALEEMTAVYRFDRWQRLRHLWLPTLSVPLGSALQVACCSGIRLVVMAEVIAAGDGAGFAIAHARGSLDSAQLYAWVVLVLLLVAAMELLLLRPVQRRLERWRCASQAGCPADAAHA